jgi:hypothetical protein
MGGLAVRIHALPRSTFDVDFMIALSRESLPELYRRAAERGYTIPPAQADGWVDQVSGMPVVKLGWFAGGHPIDVDVFLSETPFQRLVLERRIWRPVDGWGAWFVSAEDLILLKLLAGRAKDRLDVADILFIQGTLNLDYLRAQADLLGVRALLETALSEAPPT